MRFNGTILIALAATLAANTSAFVSPTAVKNHHNIITSRAKPRIYNLQQKQPWRSSSLLTTSTSTAALDVSEMPKPMSKFAKRLTKVGMIAYITTVALGFITSLSVIKLMGKLNIATEVRRQKWALSTGQFVARWALRIFPFCKVDVIADRNDNPEPAIWVCNHCSMLDVFLLLASDRKMRGKNKRPIKVVYWKQLEDNPFSKILFRESGFIPIDMTANKPGEDNEYNPASFKAFLKSCKQAFADGFDVGILPEGQLNPSPEKGLAPIFNGAYTLARMSRRPIQMIAMHGANQLWHPNDGMEVGDMNVTGRHVKIRVYPNPRKYESDGDFKETFTNVVGHFGKYGTDNEEYNEWLDGSKWKAEMEKRKEAEEAVKEARLKAEKEAEKTIQKAEEDGQN